MKWHIRNFLKYQTVVKECCCTQFLKLLKNVATACLYLECDISIETIPKWLVYIYFLFTAFQTTSLKLPSSFYYHCNYLYLINGKTWIKLIPCKISTSTQYLFTIPYNGTLLLESIHLSRDKIVIISNLVSLFLHREILTV